MQLKYNYYSKKQTLLEQQQGYGKAIELNGLHPCRAFVIFDTSSTILQFKFCTIIANLFQVNIILIN